MFKVVELWTSLKSIFQTKISYSNIHWSERKLYDVSVVIVFLILIGLMVYLLDTSIDWFIHLFWYM